MENMITVINDQPMLTEQAIEDIAMLETAIANLKEKQDVMRKALQSEMEAKGLIKVQTENVLINYVQPTDRETFDSKTFKVEHQDLYDEYVKMIPVKPTIRIKVKA